MSIPLYEQYLIKTILPELQKGREDWDEPHTQKVVEYAKEIAQHVDLDQTQQGMLVIVGYLHDYGYMFFRDELTVGPTSGRPKQEHPRHSANKWDEIQDESVFDFLSPDQKNRIKHLILVHDQVDKLVECDELLFMEADTLGALAMGNGQGIDPVRYRKYIEYTKEKRVSRFISDYGKKEAKRLLNSILK